MLDKRIIIVFGLFIGIFSILTAEIFLLSTNLDNAQTVVNQTNFSVPLADGRGNIFDFNMSPLVDVETETHALILPGEQDYKTLLERADPKDITPYSPFLVKVLPDMDLQGTHLYTTPVRYQTSPIAPHLIGYINNDRQGVSGIEYVFNDVLEKAGDKTFINCQTNALDELKLGAEPSLTAIQGTGYDVMLTLDDSLQRICEGIAAQSMDKGAIVVMETSTGRIKASVSMPTFDPEDIESSIQKDDTSLVNRPLNAFNVGSSYKPLLAGIALESGIDETIIYDCKGYTEVNGHVYRCAVWSGHGEVSMIEALESSCNGYFIHLGLLLGGDIIHDTSSLVGFGSQTHLGGGFTGKSGNLPSKTILENIGELASVSFGQGQLLATPIQMTAYFNTFANNGVYISPSLVEGFVNPYTRTVEKSFYSPQQVKVFSDSTMAKLHPMLVSVVENGIAQNALPTHGNAAGKTSTAQTGRYFTDEDGDKKELYESWFVGYYPADNPKYTISILQDSQTSISDTSGDIFADICNSLYYLALE